MQSASAPPVSRLPFWEPWTEDEPIYVNDCSPLRSAWMVACQARHPELPRLTVETVQNPGTLDRMVQPCKRVRVILEGVTFIMTHKEALTQVQILGTELNPERDPFTPLEPLCSQLVRAAAMAAEGPGRD